MASQTIRVLLVDDQQLFREGLTILLSVHDDIEIVGEAENGQKALDQVARLNPHVILMDVQMPILDGVAATRQLQAQYPDCRVIMLTTFDDDEYVFEGLRAGAVGYLLKDVPSQKLVEAIRATAKGDSFLQPSIAAKVVAEFTRIGRKTSPAPSRGQAVSPLQHSLVEPLSGRELQILKQIATGSSNREIGNALFIAEGTVKNHVTNILGKLGVRDRTQAAIKAKDLDLL